MRDWSVEIKILHEETKELVAADCFEKAVYNLHPTFGKKAKQSKQPPVPFYPGTPLHRQCRRMSLPDHQRLFILMYPARDCLSVLTTSTSQQRQVLHSAFKKKDGASSTCSSP